MNENDDSGRPEPSAEELLRAHVSRELELAERFVSAFEELGRLAGSDEARVENAAQVADARLHRAGLIGDLAEIDQRIAAKRELTAGLPLASKAGRDALETAIQTELDGLNAWFEREVARLELRADPTQAPADIVAGQRSVPDAHLGSTQTLAETIADDLEARYADATYRPERPAEVARRFGCSRRTVYSAYAILGRRGIDVPATPRRSQRPAPGERLARQIRRAYAGRRLPSQRHLAEEFSYSVTGVNVAVRYLREHDMLLEDGSVAASDTRGASDDVADDVMDAWEIAGILEERYANDATGTEVERASDLAEEFGVEPGVITGVFHIMAAHDRVVLRNGRRPTIWNNSGRTPAPETDAERVAAELAVRYGNRDMFPPGTQIAGEHALAAEFDVTPPPTAPSPHP